MLLLLLSKGTVLDRTSSVHMSVLCLLVDKGQGLRSGILCFTSVVLPPNGMLSRELKIILFRCWWLSWIKSMSLFINIFNSFILDWHKYKGFSSRFSLEGHTNIKYLLYVDLSYSMKNSWNDYSFTLIEKNVKTLSSLYIFLFFFGRKTGDLLNIDPVISAR